VRNGRYWLSALLALLGSTARGDGLGGALGVSTDDVFRGLSQSNGQPSAQAELHYAETQWSAGISAEAVRGDRDERLGPEFTAFAGYEHVLADDLGASVTLRHYDYSTFARRYDELAASVLWRTIIRATVTASPDTPSLQYQRYGPYGAYGMGGGDWAFSYEVDARVPLPPPLPPGLYADAGAGYYDVRRQAEGYD
jgi:uncharacterized protein (TIGR02001 family)